MLSKRLAATVGVVAALLGSGVLPETALAQSVQFDLRNGQVQMGGPRYDDRYDDRYGRRYERRDERSYRPACSPRSALSEASRWLDAPRIRGQNRSVYFIDGYGKRGRNRGGPDSVMIDTQTCDRR